MTKINFLLEIIDFEGGLFNEKIDTNPFVESGIKYYYTIIQNLKWV
jgi:hypothetical protein